SFNPLQLPLLLPLSLTSLFLCLLKPNRTLSQLFIKRKMSTSGLSKCAKILHIVRLRQMLRRWRNKARISANKIPSDVPSGYIAVCVGISCRRFVVRATYLNHPVFSNLLNQAEEEFGFSNQGPLTIPCDESVFEEAIRYISRSESGNLEDLKNSCCHRFGIRRKSDLWTESRPLLAEKTIWSEFTRSREYIYICILTILPLMENAWRWLKWLS
ncbi:Auxin-responsive protein SAUR50, partial [Linum grandiflorum]